ncbi:MAG: hypothetical protein IPG45_04980 [Deltaproteobacteria bacterium]|nr:hypothetical protein [Deltaproteobacteria bacterium]
MQASNLKLLPLILPLACSSPTLDDSRHPTGSRTLATSTSYQTLYAVSADEGVVSRVPSALGAISGLMIGGEPTRIARAQDRIFVTLRAQRQVAVLKDDGQGLVVETTLSVGAEPYGIVADEAGEKIYVASSQSQRVDEIDAGSLTVLRSFTIEGEPRWLALHPAGKLYVASAQGARVSTIDLEDGEIQVGHLPTIQRRGLAGTAFDLSARITGDPAVTPDGEKVVIPALYVDNTTPIAEGEEEAAAPEPSGGYGGSANEPRMNASVVMTPATGDGELLLEDAEVVRLIGQPDDATPKLGYPSSVAISPNSSLAYVSVEGADGVIALPIDATDEPGIGERLFGAFGGDFGSRTESYVTTGAGPRGLIFTREDRAYVHTFITPQVGFFSASAVEPNVLSGRGSRRTYALELEVQVAEALPEPLYSGRKHFYDTNDSRMSSPGSGLSCATCHFEGRNDGTTWTFTKGPRQTPSLAGKVSETEPVRWEADRASVAEDARRTSQGLMGGDAINENQLEALSAFIDFTRDVDVELKGQSDQSIERGRGIFFRPEVGCANCHSGARYTDNRTYAMFGMPVVKTRSLTSIAASAPYLHDGSAPTLADVVERARDGSMGNTGGLSDSERADLVRFLQSL